jgi:Uma2 family endonuclease
MVVTPTRQMSEAEYRAFALNEEAMLVELVNGQLREKPPMSFVHGHVMMFLAEQLLLQTDRSQFVVRVQHARLRVSAETFFIPDIAVIPAALERAMLAHPRDLETYTDPLPLVIEVWSPSTGTFDIREKIPGYQRRGDHEIWRVHPFERTITTWRRTDAGYAESVYREGTVRAELPAAVAIDLEPLFALPPV